MKIIIFKSHNQKSKFLVRFLLAICLTCSIFLSYIVLNQPVAIWQESENWQIKVYQKADHMMSLNPPWILINELEMNLTRQESGNVPWCLEVKDIRGVELLPGISRLVIYYSEDLVVVDGFGLNQENQKTMSIGEVFSLSLYGAEFFTPQIKRYHHLLLFVRDTVQVDISPVEGKTARWEEEYPWWILYESSQPPLKAELQQPK